MSVTDKLQINPDLTRQLVSSQGNKDNGSYGWCPFREGFSADFVTYVLAKTGLKSGCVLDPFAGTGTTLFAASNAGLSATGIELLPYGQVVISALRDVGVSDKKDLADGIKRFSEARSWERAGETIPFYHLPITRGAFPPETERQLCRYRYDACRVHNIVLGRVLGLAALSVLEEISYTRKDGQYLRWDSRSGHSAGKTFHKRHIASFTQAIQSKLARIEADLLAGAVPDGHKGRVSLIKGSCLQIMGLLAPASFDGIITSPPYCNRYDYTRTYALELALLGESADAVKSLRQAMLSCTVENLSKTDLTGYFSADVYAAAKTAFEAQKDLAEIVAKLIFCRATGMLNNPKITVLVYNYFFEMSLVIAQAAVLLKEGAPFVMVNDNVQYQWIPIPVDLILSDFAQHVGFDVEAIWVVPHGKGNSSQQMAKNGRQELRKCVYVWRKKRGTV